MDDMPKNQQPFSSTIEGMKFNQFQMPSEQERFNQRMNNDLPTNLPNYNPMYLELNPNYDPMNLQPNHNAREEKKVGETDVNIGVDHLTYNDKSNWGVGANVTTNTKVFESKTDKVEAEAEVYGAYGQSFGLSGGHGFMSTPTGGFGMGIRFRF